MSKYLNFVEVFDTTIVMSNKRKEPLGKIVYYPRWKQYVFESFPDTVFNDECLVDIVSQIKSLNKNRGKSKDRR